MWGEVVSAYYNEIDPYAAAWLRNLIEAGHIAAGVVDERSIDDVLPDDLRGFTQCHFFAGIGVWSYALRRAGWTDERPVWTGSCPCQPFSAAGKGAGFADQRHLWPAWHHLIRECCPAVVFGEQVASSDAGPWIDLVQDDMEAMGYAFGAVPFPAAGVGAPHIRDRLYFVADADRSGRTPRGEGRSAVGHRQAAGTDRGTGELGHAPRDGWEQSGLHSQGGGKPLETGQELELRNAGSVVRPGPTNGLWAAADWVYCRDGKWRPVEPGTFPLAHGAPARVGRLRAYGNAICAPAAQAFISSCLDLRAAA